MEHKHNEEKFMKRKYAKIKDLINLINTSRIGFKL